VPSSAEEFGPYLVYEQIGVGGMATVHRAETTGIAGFRKLVALKRMLPHIAANDDLVRSFVREARLASHLRHGNVAQTYDLGKVGDIYFIAMELVTGRTLREILRLCIKTNIRVPIGITLNVLNQVCDALDYAHNLCDDSGQPLGIVHRDVSPSNVIVSDSGVVKLIDFGIAKASAAGMQTLSGTIKGKFGYMAPEYLMGKIDARADLFAAGICAYELLTNKPLFQGRDDMDTLYRVKSMPIPRPSETNPEIPPEIDSIVMTALERDPDARWQRAAAMRIALTTEMKRLGLTMLDQQVREWCDNLFDGHVTFDVDSQPPTRVLGTEPSIEISHAPDDDDDMGRTSLRDSNPRAATVAARPSSRRSDEPGSASPLPRPPPSPSHPPMRSGSASNPPPLPPTRPTPQSTSAPRLGSPSSPPQLGAPPLSGARTLPGLRRTLHVEAADVLAEVSLAQASRAVPVKRMGAFVIVMLLILTAGAAAAVVYFGLPYIYP
jgi:eukaryotic-like serine/threonine-protein kinase